MNLKNPLPSEVAFIMNKPLLSNNSTVTPAIGFSPTPSLFVSSRTKPATMRPRSSRKSFPKDFSPAFSAIVILFGSPPSLSETSEKSGKLTSLTMKLPAGMPSKM
jgi:hypothetical protein